MCTCLGGGCCVHGESRHPREASTKNKGVSAFNNNEAFSL